jgi:HSP20 family protein
MPTTEIVKAGGTSPTRPGDIFAAMRLEMDRLFQRFEQHWPRWSGLEEWPRWPSVLRRTIGGELVVPQLDVHENAKSIIIEAELPGVDEKDVSITFANGHLTIKGEKKQEREEKDESHYLAERNFGAFERCLRLPDTIDETRIEARFDKGVLKITAAKKPEAIKAERKIEIRKG